METNRVEAQAGAVVTVPDKYKRPVETSPAPSNELGKDDFLQLLVAQLKYQDPLAPTSSEEFISTTAQFTVVEKLDELTKQGESSALVQSLTTASSLVGREVTANRDGQLVDAVVDHSRIVGGEVVLDSDVGEIRLDQIVSVGAVTLATLAPAQPPASAVQPEVPVPPAQPEVPATAPADGGETVDDPVEAVGADVVEPAVDGGNVAGAAATTGAAVDGDIVDTVPPESADAAGAPDGTDPGPVIDVDQQPVPTPVADDSSGLDDVAPVAAPPTTADPTAIPNPAPSVDNPVAAGPPATESAGDEVIIDDTAVDVTAVDDSAVDDTAVDDTAVDELTIPLEDVLNAAQPDAAPADDALPAAEPIDPVVAPAPAPEQPAQPLSDPAVVQAIAALANPAVAQAVQVLTDPAIAEAVQLLSRPEIQLALATVEDADAANVRALTESPLFAALSAVDSDGDQTGLTTPAAEPAPAITATGEVTDPFDPFDPLG